MPKPPPVRAIRPRFCFKRTGNDSRQIKESAVPQLSDLVLEAEALAQFWRALGALPSGSTSAGRVID